MEDLSKDRLMRLQVEQLEKEKKDLNERLRIASKRIDHVERAYRKEECPLLGQDYAEQQTTDRATFEAVQKARLESSVAAHKEAVTAKKRLARIVDDFRKHKEMLLSARSEEFKKRRAAAEKKIEEEKEARRQAHAASIAEETRRREQAETEAREAEEDRLRVEAGACHFYFLRHLLVLITHTQNRTTSSRRSRSCQETRRRGAAG
jgi:translation initiation factor 3 subunit A